jgi:single-stranded-DNA-specific exonuclease
MTRSATTKTDAQLELTLRRDASRCEAIYFNHAKNAPQRIRAADRLAVNEFNGMASVQLVLEHLETA